MLVTAAGTIRQHVDLAAAGNGEPAGSIGVAGGRIEDHSSLRGNDGAFGGRDVDRSGAWRCGRSAVGANEIAEQRAQIAGAFGGGRNRRDDGSGATTTETLIVGEEEELVFENRAADRAAELIPAQRQTLLRRPVFRVEEVVAEIFKQRAVEVVAAGFCGRLKQRACDGAECGVVVPCRHLEFLERVDIGVDDGDAENRAIVFRAVEQEAVRGELLAIDVDLVAALRIFGRGVLPIVELRARRDEQRLCQVAVEDGEAAEFVSA